MATPDNLDFGQVSVGEGAQLGVTLQNTDTNPTTITNLTLSDPGGNGFTILSGLPPNFQLLPLGSVTVTVRFVPTQANPDDDLAQGSLTVTSQESATDVDTTTVPLTGQGFTGSPAVTITGPRLVRGTINFGQVVPGATSTTTFTLTNTGTADMTINKAAPPAAPFTVPAPISEGLTIEPGDSLNVTVSCPADDRGAGPAVVLDHHERRPRPASDQRRREYRHLVGSAEGTPGLSDRAGQRRGPSHADGRRRMQRQRGPAHAFRR